MTGYIYKVTDENGSELKLPVTVSDAVYVNGQTLTTVLGNISAVDNVKHLYLGNVQQGKPSSDGKVSSDSTYVTTQEYMVPEVGVTITFKLPSNIRCVVYHGINAHNLLTSGTLSNGGSYTFANGGSTDVTTNNTDMVYRIAFRKYNGSYSSITANEVQSLISSKDIDITYEILDNSNIFDRNDNSVLPAARCNPNDHQAPYYNKYACIYHISDVHSDKIRLENFFHFTDITKPTHLVLSGDLVNYGRYTNDWSYITEGIEDHDISIPSLPCIGNHEMNYITLSDAYTTYLKYFVDKYGYTHTGSNTYFYWDDTTYKIRFISFNQNEYDVASTSWKYIISSTQINWFINTLKSTPANYGVILICHMPETMPSYYSAGNYDYRNWFGNNQNYNSNNFWRGTGTPLTRIIDAFIRRISVSASYTNASPGGTVSYTADFSSGVASGANFICWMTGHLHCDCVGYVNYSGSTVKQVMLNITCGNAGASTAGDYSEDDDLPRMTWGKTQDAFNAYVIDTDNKKIKLMRIGSDVSRDQNVRSYAEISYAN